MNSSDVNTSRSSSADSSDDLVSDEESSQSECDTEDEIEADTTPIHITPPSKPSKNQQKVLNASSLPLVAVLNARSLYVKADNFKLLLNELGIELGIVVET